MQQRQPPGKCPVCGDVFHVTRLACDSCKSVLEGRFFVCRFCQLSAEQQKFVEAFIVNRGNIKEMERVLGISYPTVRNRLDGVIRALGYEPHQDFHVASSEKRKEILASLDKGELSAQEAIRRLSAATEATEKELTENG